MKAILKARQELRAIRKAEQQAAFERRLRARELLFGKGRGLSKNLPYLEQRFVSSVWKECYQHYLIEFATGNRPRMYAPAAKRFRRVHRDRERPMSAGRHRMQWYRSQKARWIRHDMPALMKERMEEVVHD